MPPFSREWGHHDEADGKAVRTTVGASLAHLRGRAFPIAGGRPRLRERGAAASARVVPAVTPVSMTQEAAVDGTPPAVA